MEQSMKMNIKAAVETFDLPQYDTIPDVGLYLEQVTRYVCDCLAPLEITITTSMVGNYVKKGLISNPVKKLYSREQIAYLIFIAVAKTVLSLEDIQLLIGLQKKTYSPKVASDYFRKEFKNVLDFVFDLKDTLQEVGSEQSDERIMLRNTIITVAYKVYLDKCFSVLAREGQRMAL